MVYGRLKIMWTKEEDEALREQVQLHGVDKWPIIASNLHGKTSRQCRRRWHAFLNVGNKRGGWSPEEDTILLESHRKFGNRWTEIAKCLQGRTDNAVKNRFCVLCKRKTKESGPAALQTSGGTFWGSNKQEIEERKPSPLEDIFVKRSTNPANKRMRTAGGNNKRPQRSAQQQALVDDTFHKLTNLRSSNVQGLSLQQSAPLKVSASPWDSSKPNVPQPGGVSGKRHRSWKQLAQKDTSSFTQSPAKESEGTPIGAPGEVCPSKLMSGVVPPLHARPRPAQQICLPIESSHLHERFHCWRKTDEVKADAEPTKRQRMPIFSEADHEGGIHLAERNQRTWCEDRRSTTDPFSPIHPWKQDRQVYSQCTPENQGLVDEILNSVVKVFVSNPIPCPPVEDMQECTKSEHAGLNMSKAHEIQKDQDPFESGADERLCPRRCKEALSRWARGWKTTKAADSLKVHGFTLEPNGPPTIDTAHSTSQLTRSPLVTDCMPLPHFTDSEKEFLLSTLDSTSTAPSLSPAPQPQTRISKVRNTLIDIRYDTPARSPLSSRLLRQFQISEAARLA